MKERKEKVTERKKRRKHKMKNQLKGSINRKHKGKQRRMIFLNDERFKRKAWKNNIKGSEEIRKEN